MSFLLGLESLTGMLQRLPGMLVPRQAIFFSVMSGGSAMCVRSLLMEFGSPLMRVVWHDIFSSIVPKCVSLPQIPETGRAGSRQGF